MNGSETLDRIQQEIKEALQREEELKKGYEKMNNNNNNNESVKTNGDMHSHHQEQILNGGTPNGTVPVNGTTKIPPTTPTQNGRRFAPNPLAKGIMHKFLRMRGKVNAVNAIRTTNGGTSPKTWSLPEFELPAKATIEPGKTVRNGFIPAEEKMRRELKEFQQREDELRKERRKSQPDLMAAIESEEIPLKPTRSMAQLYSLSVEDSSETSSEPASLKPAKSLAELCDIDDDLPGTHSLIRQFESLKEQGRI